LGDPDITDCFMYLYTLLKTDLSAIPHKRLSKDYGYGMFDKWRRDVRSWELAMELEEPILQAVGLASDHYQKECNRRNDAFADSIKDDEMGWYLAHEIIKRYLYIRDISKDDLKTVTKDEWKAYLSDRGQSYCGNSVVYDGYNFGFISYMRNSVNFDVSGRVTKFTPSKVIKNIMEYISKG